MASNLSSWVAKFKPGESLRNWLVVEGSHLSYALLKSPSIGLCEKGFLSTECHVQKTSSCWGQWTFPEKVWVPHFLHPAGNSYCWQSPGLSRLKCLAGGQHLFQISFFLNLVTVANTCMVSKDGWKVCSPPFHEVLEQIILNSLTFMNTLSYSFSHYNKC